MLLLCPVCGDTKNVRRDAVTCSPRCGNIRRDRARTNLCTELGCGRGVRAKGLCSMHWKRAGRAAGTIPNEPWNDRRRANWKRRYALTRGAPVGEAFDYKSVFVRDGWACGICAAPVDPDLVWPDPMSASLDHIVPVAHGGRHAPENAQCAHLICNVRKGAAA